MSPVFRHGRLRLYLLKLLDEAPRHGYEVIRLLQDRFLGVYAPSPGTIYPRLARLEEDGLVTHEEVNGKKIYSITDKGREEIRSRLGELTDLEDELTASLRDVAREISEDVRDTVRSIREELVSAARDLHPADKPSRPAAASSEAGDATAADTKAGRDEARRIRAEARRSREEMRAGFRARSRGRGDWAAWQQRIGRPDVTSWTSWADWATATSEDAPGDEDATAGRGAAAGKARTAGHGGAASRDGGTGRDSGTARDSATGRDGATGRDSGSQAGERPRPGGPGRGYRTGPGPFSDLERMAIQFATELRAAARQTGDLGERSLNDLRDILTDTLARVRDEVLSPGGASRDAGEPADGQAAQPTASGESSTPAADGGESATPGGEEAAGGSAEADQ